MEKKLRKSKATFIFFDVISIEITRKNISRYFFSSNFDRNYVEKKLRLGLLRQLAAEKLN